MKEGYRNEVTELLNISGVIATSLKKSSAISYKISAIVWICNVPQVHVLKTCPQLMAVLEGVWTLKDVACREVCLWGHGLGGVSGTPAPFASSLSCPGHKESNCASPCTPCHDGLLYHKPQSDRDNNSLPEISRSASYQQTFHLHQLSRVFVIVIENWLRQLNKCFSIDLGNAFLHIF